LGDHRPAFLAGFANPQVAAVLAALVVFWSFARLGAYVPHFSSALLPYSVSRLLLIVWVGALLLSRPTPVVRPALLLVGLFLVLRLDVLNAFVAGALYGSLACDEARQPPTERALMAAAALLGVLALVFLGTVEASPYTSAMRFKGPMSDPNDAAQIALLGAVPALFLLKLGQGRALGVGAAVAGLALVAVVASQSRAGVAVAVVMAGMMALGPLRRRPALAVAVCAVAGLALALAPQSLWHRFGELITLEDTGHRLDLARAGWAMFIDYPLLGVGPGAFAEHSGGMTPHSVLIAVPAEGGLLLMLVFVAMCVAVLRDWWAARDHALAWVTPLALVLAATGPMDARVLALCLVMAPLTEASRNL